MWQFEYISAHHGRRCSPGEAHQSVILASCLESSAASGEPELRGDLRIHEGLEHIGGGTADEHPRLHDRRLGQSQVVHAGSYRRCSMSATTSRVLRTVANSPW